MKKETEKNVRAAECASQITVSIQPMSISKHSSLSDGWICCSIIEMDVTEEATIFFRKIESDLSTSIPSHVKNAFL